MIRGSNQKPAPFELDHGEETLFAERKGFAKPQGALAAAKADTKKHRANGIEAAPEPR
jgi:hypothetical protein